jgi:DNA-binding CsgD family transcriptional regulator
LNFKINTDTWFIICVLFIGILGLLILSYIAIPYRTRTRNTKRRQKRLMRRLEKFEQLEKKYSEDKIKNLKVTNKKLQTDLKDDLAKILSSDEIANFESFFSNFEKLYPDFKTSLNKITSNLTANELKLCAFLRLNLSSKEISMLLNITPESVHKARYRLRKKLALTSKEDLSIFIINI